MYAAAVREATEHAIFVINEDGTILSWNRGAQTIFGFTEDEVVGTSFERLFTPEEVEQGIPALEIEEARTKGKGEDRRWHMRRDGSRFFSEGVTFPLGDDSGIVAYAKIASDATERRMAETQLAALNATLRVLSEYVDIDSAAPDLLSAICEQLDWQYGQFWLVDDDEDVINCVETWAPATSELEHVQHLCGGRPLRRGEGLPGIVWQDAAPKWIENLSGESSLPRHAVFEKLSLASALAFPILVDGSVMAVLELFSRSARTRDIHIINTLAGVGAQIGLFIARKRAEDALRESEEQYRIVAETASDAIVTMSDDGVVRYANPATRKIFGWEPQELVGRPLDVLMPERMRQSHRAGVARYLRTHKRNIPWSGVELPGLHRDGHEIQIEVSFGELAGEGRHLFTGVMRDITARKKTEEENAQLYREAQEANRTKDEFLATVSHELRTPMTAVLGWTRVLRMGADAETLSEALEAIERSATAQAQLIDDILDVSRITMGKLRFRAEPVQLRDIVSSALDTVKLAAEARSLHINAQLEEKMPIVMGDPSRLQQVVWNLLSNAIKFTPDGGTVTVRLAKQGDAARLQVSDTGEGIAADFLPHLFERFRQAEGSSRRSHGGLGLGLAIVKHLIELHGGTVSAESAGAGKGSTFTVDLPFARDVHEVGESTVTHRLRRRDGDALENLDGISVLLVEDDPDTRTFLAALLRKAGATVTDASGVVEALRKYGESTPDVIVSDLAMPERDGFDLVRTIREMEGTGRHTPVVAVTASGVGRDRERALQAGFDEYFRKPVEPDALLHWIANAVE